MNPIGAREARMAWRVEAIDETGSTNDLVLERARKGEAEGLVVRAASQRRGKGRRGRSWFSPPGSGLYFSALLRPAWRAETLPAMTLLLGVAVAEGLEEATGCRIGLKWPNDLRVEGRKIGGILCECAAAPNAPPAVAAGVGVNLTTEKTDFPLELRDSASSVLLSGGRTPDAAHLLPLLLGRVALRLEEYEAEGFGAVRSRWLRLCDHPGEEISVRAADGKIKGKSRGIDEAGRLLLERPDGSVERINSGKVENA